MNLNHEQFLQDLGGILIVDMHTMRAVVNDLEVVLELSIKIAEYAQC